MRAVESALQQDYDAFEVIVSDNSTNDDTQKLFTNFSYPKLKYIRRIPSTTSNGHFNLVLSNVTSDYFILFHDDDEMYPDMVKTLHNTMTNNPSVVAAGADADRFKDGKKYKRFMKPYKGDILLTSRAQVAEKYLKGNGMAPFPSYMYKNIVAQKLRFDLAHGGKYCDAAFLMDTATIGNIMLIAKPLMKYYYHTSQDSQQLSFYDKMSFIRFIHETTCFKKNHGLLRQFRLQTIYEEMDLRLTKDNNLLTIQRLRNILHLFFISLSIKLFFKLSVKSFLYLLKTNNIAFNKHKINVEKI
jgi:glycosyltransferase involved in cell wall biosynthesis